MFICEHEGCSEHIHAGWNALDDDNHDICPLTVPINLMIQTNHGFENYDGNGLATQQQMFLANSRRRKDGVRFKCKKHAKLDADDDDEKNDKNDKNKVDFEDFLFVEQKEMSYEEALVLFTSHDESSGQMIQVYDYKYRWWREAEYVRHFDKPNKPKRIMVYHPGGYPTLKKHQLLAFPCVNIRLKAKRAKQRNRRKNYSCKKKTVV